MLNTDISKERLAITYETASNLFFFLILVFLSNISLFTISFFGMNNQHMVRWLNLPQSRLPKDRRGGNSIPNFRISNSLMITASECDCQIINVIVMSILNGSMAALRLPIQSYTPQNTTFDGAISISGGFMRCECLQPLELICISCCASVIHSTLIVHEASCTYSKAAGSSG